MSIPHFSTLQKINEIENKISLLEAELSNLENHFTETKSFYENAEKQEYFRLLEIYTQENLLESIQREISELRVQETAIKNELDHKINTAIESFLSQNGYQDLIQRIWKKELGKKENLHIEVTQDMSSLVADYPSKIIPGTKNLRIKSDNKTYILDKDVLVKELSQKILVKTLSS